MAFGVKFDLYSAFQMNMLFVSDAKVLTQYLVRRTVCSSFGVKRWIFYVLSLSLSLLTCMPTIFTLPLEGYEVFCLSCNLFTQFMINYLAKVAFGVLKVSGNWIVQVVMWSIIFLFQFLYIILLKYFFSHQSKFCWILLRFDEISFPCSFKIFHHLH